jgi:hypothetical protein
MDAATGTFLGEVRDYWVADNGLVHKVHYAQGLREGAYEAHHRNQQVAVRGQFTQGRPQAGDASAPMEPFHFGKSCEEQAARAAATAAQKAWAASAVIVGPKPPGEPSAYQRKLLERLHNFNTLTQWMPRTDGQTTVITADVDATGRLSNFASASGVLSSAFASIMTSLGTWHPATVNRLPVPGKIRITLAMYSTQLQSSLQSHVAYPLPREVLQTAK